MGNIYKCKWHTSKYVVFKLCLIQRLSRLKELPILLTSISHPGFGYILIFTNTDQPVGFTMDTVPFTSQRNLLQLIILGTLIQKAITR